MPPSIVKNFKRYTIVSVQAQSIGAPHNHKLTFVHFFWCGWMVIVLAENPSSIRRVEERRIEHPETTTGV